MWSLVSRPGQASEPESSRLFCEPCPAPPPTPYRVKDTPSLRPPRLSGGRARLQVWGRNEQSSRMDPAGSGPSGQGSNPAAIMATCCPVFSPAGAGTPVSGRGCCVRPSCTAGGARRGPPASVRSERRQTCVFPCQHVPCVCVHACVCARACVCTRVCVHVCVCAHMLVPTSVTCRPQPCWPLASSVGTSTH